MQMNVLRHRQKVVDYCAVVDSSAMNIGTILENANVTGASSFLKFCGPAQNAVMAETEITHVNRVSAGWLRNQKQNRSQLQHHYLQNHHRYLRILQYLDLIQYIQHYHNRQHHLHLEVFSERHLKILEADTGRYCRRGRTRTA